MKFLRTLFILLALLALAGISTARAGDESMNIIRDEEIEQSLKTMIKPVFSQAGLSVDTVKFIIVESSELNAFVAGGQNIFLYTEMLLRTENPEELIGVIAHESGHIADGHLFRGQADMSDLSMEALLANVLGMLVAVGAHAPGAGMAIGSAGDSVLTRMALRHTRTQEGSADQAGVRFLQGAGLPVTGFLSFMKKLGSQELIPESQQSEYVRTHPLTQDRIDFLQHMVDTGPAGAIPPEWVELHHRLHAKLLGFLFPDRALQQTDNSVASQYGRAVAWFRKGQLDKALAILDPLIKQEPKNPYFYELKGQMLFENGKIEESIPPYAEAVSLAPFSGLIRISYAHSLLESRLDKEGRTKEAIKQLNLALEKEKHVSQPHHMLAIAYGKLGEEGLSRLHLAEEALMQGHKDFAEREANLAKVNLKKGTPSYQRALDILEVMKKKDKKDEKKD